MDMHIGAFGGFIFCCWNMKCCIQGVICEAFEMCWDKLFEHKIALTKRLQWNYSKCSNPLGSVTLHGTLPYSIGNTSTNGGVFHCYVSLRECNIKFSTFWNGFLQSCICLNCIAFIADLRLVTSKWAILWLTIVDIRGCYPKCCVV